MYARSRKLKATLPLLLAMSIAVSGFGDLALAGRCTAAPDTARSLPCCANQCCCSGETGELRACCCVKKLPTPQPPTSSVNASPLELKLALSTHPAFAFATLTQVNGLPFTDEARFSSPIGPSVRLLCCIWRI
jgi:hypothetical protein